MTVLAFALLGLGTGAVLALLSVGLLVIYRGSGILNLAHGAYAMFTAYFYWQLRRSGLGVIPAMVVGVGVAGLAGFVTDQGVMRRLRRASPLARLIATAGMLLLLQATVAVIWSVVPKTVPSIIPSPENTAFGSTPRIRAPQKIDYRQLQHRDEPRADRAY